jgi:hypothetical protein
LPLERFVEKRPRCSTAFRTKTAERERRLFAAFVALRDAGRNPSRSSMRTNALGTVNSGVSSGGALPASRWKAERFARRPRRSPLGHAFFEQRDEVVDCERLPGHCHSLVEAQHGPRRTFISKTQNMPGKQKEQPMEFGCSCLGNR